MASVLSIPQSSKMPLQLFKILRSCSPSPQQQLVIDHASQGHAPPRRLHILRLEVLDGIQVGEVHCGTGWDRYQRYSTVTRQYT